MNDGIRQKTDLTGTLDGSNQDLSVSRGADGSATVRTVDGGYFVKGDKAFWISTTKAPEATALLLAGKWVKAPGSMADSLSGLTIRSFLDESIGPGNITDAELAKATTRTTTFDGKPAYVITDAKTGNTITLDAATKYVLQFDGEQGTSKTKGKVTLTGWNQQPTLTVPPGAISAPSSMGN
ncbi:hypothetical protein EFY87_02075 [Flexivirga caeni]|uniref:Lipoprotein n=1 Tax=Flexivirga caeni TaxID=2294115 RepID=A0A3M9MIM9_9MICO|nr:hypothetical protein EFY87_02075 [Flexivirga caeni]